MKPNAFVAIPFDQKPDRKGTPINRNRVYAERVKPKLEVAGCRSTEAKPSAK